DHNGLKSIKTSSNDGVTSEYRECYLCISNNDSLTIEIEQQPYYMRLDYVYTLSFTINQKLPTTFNASQQFNFENASTNIKASGTINVSELTTNSKLTFQSYLSTTKDIYGKIKTSSTDENNSFEKTVNKLLEQAISDTRKILSDTGIGITMADIGFKKLY
ncbi:MAG: hypothetical protein IJO19_00240, partial [Clostridia bacterium]|nr:hypothetical protein [Clostridia bacterium]